MSDSIFTKIVKGEIPSHKIYEDEKTIAFMDINPAVPGHVLVVPKAQVDHLWDLDDEDYHALQSAAKKVANRQREVLSPARVGVHVVGVDVPHAHIHLVPINSAEDYWRQPEQGREPDHVALAAMAERLSF